MDPVRCAFRDLIERAASRDRTVTVDAACARWLLEQFARLDELEARAETPPSGFDLTAEEASCPPPTC